MRRPCAWCMALAYARHRHYQDPRPCADQLALALLGPPLRELRPDRSRSRRGRRPARGQRQTGHGPGPGPRRRPGPRPRSARPGPGRASRTGPPWRPPPSPGSARPRPPTTVTPSVGSGSTRSRRPTRPGRPDDRRPRRRPGPRRGPRAAQRARARRPGRPARPAQERPRGRGPPGSRPRRPLRLLRRRRVLGAPPASSAAGTPTMAGRAACRVPGTGSCWAAGSRAMSSGGRGPSARCSARRRPHPGRATGPSRRPASGTTAPWLSGPGSAGGSRRRAPHHRA
jgi:hypothetical protein